MTLAATVRDAAAVMAAGRTFLLPVESDQLYCLNSVNGKLLWSCPREEMLFIAGVVADKVVLAGPRGLFARNLETGKSAWREERIVHRRVRRRTMRRIEVIYGFRRFTRVYADVLDVLQLRDSNSLFSGARKMSIRN